MDINPHTHEHLIFDKETKIIQRKKRNIFKKWSWHNWMSTCRRIKINPYLSQHKKLESKWIKNLNKYQTTLNLIEKKEGSCFQCMSTGEHFLNITPVAQTLRTISKWDLLKLRSIFKAKNTINKPKRQPTE